MSDLRKRYIKNIFSERKKLKNRKFYIISACFLTAFAVIGAGFAFKGYLSDKKYTERENSYRQMTLSDCAEALDRLSEGFSILERSSENDRPAILSDIKTSAELSNVAFGYLNTDGTGTRKLFAFLTGVASVADSAIKNGIAPEEADKNTNSPKLSQLITLGESAKRITNEAAELLNGEIIALDKKLTEIFADTVTETILYELGHLNMIESTGFETVGGGKTEEKDALKAARSYLGKKAFLKVTLSGSNPSVYCLSGENISALISEKSGYLMQLLFDLPEGEIKLSLDTAREKADSFLKEVGFSAEDCEISGEMRDGIYVFKYSPIFQNDILCLSESIIVGVSGSSGRICRFDALDYYRYHTKSLSAPASCISPREIADMHQFDPSSAQLCKIERAPGIESYCYRFSSDGENIFVSALTGELIEF